MTKFFHFGDKIISVLFVTLVGLCLFNYGCDDQQDQQQESSSDSSTQKKYPKVDYHSVDGFFGGSHPLALIGDITKDRYDTGYICLTDAGNPGTVKFYFQQNDGFLNALLPMNKVRIFLLADTSKENPYCKFRWGPNDFKEREWENNVVYAVVYVKPNQIYRK